MRPANSGAADGVGEALARDGDGEGLVERDRDDVRELVPVDDGRE